MRLIDADTKLTVLMFDEGREEWYTEEMTVDDLISKFADETPPTIDAVPVVRCKDCRFYKTHYWNEEFRLCDFGMPPRADGFCSWAWTGRKEE